MAFAAGKGVIIAQTEEEAIEAARDMLSGASFGESGSSIVIEEFMDGEELSFFAFSDGQSILSLPSAQRPISALDGDEGPNTGGMGAYSPARLMDDALEAKIMDRIITPTVKAMEAEGCPFIGILFAGLMVVTWEPYLIEYNVRFGDPECQTILPRLQGDLLKLLQACAQGKLAEIKDTITWSSEVCICVVMAANGYPGSYDKGTVIKGIEEANAQDGVMVFHAGTAQDGDTITLLVAACWALPPAATISARPAPAPMLRSILLIGRKASAVAILPGAQSFVTLILQAIQICK